MAAQRIVLIDKKLALAAPERRAKRDKLLTLHIFLNPRDLFFNQACSNV